MKRLYTSLQSLNLFLASCSYLSPQPAPTPTPNIEPFQIPWADRSLFQNELVESARPVLNDLQGASVYHLELIIHTDYHHVTGREEV